MECLLLANWSYRSQGNRRTTGGRAAASRDNLIRNRLNDAGLSQQGAGLLQFHDRSVTLDAHRPTSSRKQQGTDAIGQPASMRRCCAAVDVRGACCWRHKTTAASHTQLPTRPSLSIGRWHPGTQGAETESRWQWQGGGAEDAGRSRGHAHRKSGGGRGETRTAGWNGRRRRSTVPRVDNAWAFLWTINTGCTLPPMQFDCESCG